MPVNLRSLLSGRGLPGGRPGGPPTAFPVAVVTMEVQRGVVGDLASFPELAAIADAAGLVPNTVRLLNAARRAGLPVVHCTAEFRADRAGTTANTPLHSALLRRPEHLLVGTPATELVPALGPEPTDLVCARRHGVSPFTGTSLDATLRNLGVQVLVVAGVSVNLGVLGLCVEAVNLGYQVAVPTDAVAGVPADYAQAVLRGSIALVATLTTVDDVIAALGSP
ncbi:MAG TPA: cysteine hydrolase [Acidimicrobiales bacterium]|nr:cysteine hydrolase [Acidimicrobiales bacterium]